MDKRKILSTSLAELISASGRSIGQAAQELGMPTGSLSSSIFHGRFSQETVGSFASLVGTTVDELKNMGVRIRAPRKKPSRVPLNRQYGTKDVTGLLKAVVRTKRIVNASQLLALIRIQCELKTDMSPEMVIECLKKL